MFDLSLIRPSKEDIRRGITFPTELTEGLAELIGIIVGDGHLSVLTRINKKGSIFTQSDLFIAGNKEEKKYLDYIHHLFLPLFNYSLSYREDKRSKAVLLTAHSKGIVQFFNIICGIKIGRKVDCTTIPNIIKKADPKIQFAFLRGLFDTDFSLTFRKNSQYRYPTIKGSFCSKALVNNLEILFHNLKYKHCCCYNLIHKDKRFGYTITHSIYLNGHKNLTKWISEIGSSNEKFQVKMHTWKALGYCTPNKKESPGRDLNSRFLTKLS